MPRTSKITSTVSDIEVERQKRMQALQEKMASVLSVRPWQLSTRRTSGLLKILIPPAREKRSCWDKKRLNTHKDPSAGIS